MKHHRIVLWAAGTALCAGAFAQSEGPARATPAPAFNGVIFEEQVRAKLDGKVKAYAFAVSDTQGIEATAAGGWAQDPNDGNLRMTRKVPSGIGSVTKMFTGTALLQLFERRMLSNGTVDQQLDTPIWDKLPPKWRTSYAGKGIDKVTYRQLLQHRSGFPGKDCGGELETDEMLARGIKAQDVGNRCYSNLNVKLLRFLLPAIAYPADSQAMYEKHKNLDIGDYTAKLNVEMSHQFERYMRDEFFPRSNDPLSVSCRPQKDFGANKAAKQYSNKSDTSGRFIKFASEELKPDHYCATQGSWYASAEHLALFGRNLLYTDRWVSADTRRIMWPNGRPNDRLPWDNTINSARSGTWPYHSGIEGGYRAALVMLPNGHVGAGLINSGDMGPGEVARVLMDAFDAATLGEPVARAWHGLTQAEYQRNVSEMDESAHRVDWVDFYNVGEKVYVNAVVRPAGQGPKNYVRHNLTAQAYQDEYDKHVKTGKLRLLMIDSYLHNGQVRYAFVMAPGDGRGVPAYHGVDAATHKQQFDDHTGRGFVPTSVSVVVVGGKALYSTTWQKNDLGTMTVRSTLDGQEYQALADEMAQKKMELLYLNSYSHGNEVRYSAVFVQRLDRPQVWRHDMSGADYQRTFDDMREKGFGLRMVAGAGQGSAHRYAAVWER